ncbi:MAG: DUF1003 domain-containing protein [Bdellovibrionota bacterium]|nr:MAG: DUF1003 domain-containing protein [Pseudomonadota bacterium]
MTKNDPHRFHVPYAHLTSVFGGDSFGKRAEAFARFFGTPTFLGLQTVIVGAWVIVNALGYFHFDPYPFILLNLVFSLQAAYAAPLILLAQTRQADRDKAGTEADAVHRESLAQASKELQMQAVEQNKQLLDILRVNTELTVKVHEMSERINQLTEQIHSTLIRP